MTNSNCFRRRRGFTLIEVLAVIAIVFVLISLLLPAVQKVRESAARTQCANKLLQIGLALHDYHDSNRRFPPGYVSGVDAAGNETGPGWGWAAHILPHLEQRDLWETVRFDQPIEAAVNLPARETRLRMFLCSSDFAPATFPANKYGPAGNVLAPICEVASANYVGVFGVSEPGEDGEGIFFRNSKVRTADIKDGAGQTLMVGEREHKLSPATWVGAVTGAELFPHASASLVLGRIGDDPGPEINGFSSLHSGGTHFLFADGHVRFFTSAVSTGTLQALATRAGSDLVEGGY